MPVEEATVTSITCDNPACPGNELDKNDRTGWLFVTTEVYGDLAQQHVYCCADCAGKDAPASFGTPEAETEPK